MFILIWLVHIVFLKVCCYLFSTTLCRNHNTRCGYIFILDCAFCCLYSIYV